MFECGNLVKHSKYELWNPLKKLPDTSDYQFDKTEVTGLAVAVDFMSVIHKTVFEKHQKIKDDFKRVWNSIIVQSNATRIEIVYNSYLKNSIKESLRMQRAIEEPIEIMNLNLDSPVPSEIKKFWAPSVNKETPTNAVIFFRYKAKEAWKNIVLNGYVTDNNGSFDDLEMINDEVTQRADLNCMKEDADSRLILQVANARAKGFKNFLVLSNDSDIVTYFSAYFNHFKTKPVEKIQGKYGLKQQQRQIQIHLSGDILDSCKSRGLLKTHILTGCDFESKVGSKYHPSMQNQTNFV